MSELKGDKKESLDINYKVFKPMVEISLIILESMNFLI